MEYKCGQCDYVINSPQAIGRHKSREHGTRPAKLENSTVKDLLANIGSVVDLDRISKSIPPEMLVELKTLDYKLKLAMKEAAWEESQDLVDIRIISRKVTKRLKELLGDETGKAIKDMHLPELLKVLRALDAARITRVRAIDTLQEGSGEEKSEALVNNLIQILNVSKPDDEKEVDMREFSDGLDPKARERLKVVAAEAVRMMEEGEEFEDEDEAGEEDESA